MFPLLAYLMRQEHKTCKYVRKRLSHVSNQSPDNCKIQTPRAQEFRAKKRQRHKHVKTPCSYSTRLDDFRPEFVTAADGSPPCEVVTWCTSLRVLETRAHLERLCMGMRLRQLHTSYKAGALAQGAVLHLRRDVISSQTLRAGGAARPPPPLAPHLHIKHHARVPQQHPDGILSGEQPPAQQRDSWRPAAQAPIASWIGPPPFPYRCTSCPAVTQIVLIEVACDSHKHHFEAQACPSVCIVAPQARLCLLTQHVGQGTGPRSRQGAMTLFATDNDHRSFECVQPSHMHPSPSAIPVRNPL